MHGFDSTGSEGPRNRQGHHASTDVFDEQLLFAGIFCRSSCNIHVLLRSHRIQMSLDLFLSFLMMLVSQVRKTWVSVHSMKDTIVCFRPAVGFCRQCGSPARCRASGLAHCVPWNTRTSYLLELTRQPGRLLAGLRRGAPDTRGRRLAGTGRWTARCSQKAKRGCC